MKKSKTKKYYGILILVAVILVVLVFYFNFINNKSEADIPPVLSESSKGLGNVSVEMQNSLIYNSANLAGIIDKAKLVGSWNAFVDEVDGVKSDVANTSITFYDNETYFSVDSGVSDNGFYKIQDSQGESEIIFYHTGDDLNDSDSVSSAYGNINGTKLILVYPKYRRVIAFEKV